VAKEKQLGPRRFRGFELKAGARKPTCESRCLIQKNLVNTIGKMQRISSDTTRDLKILTKIPVVTTISRKNSCQTEQLCSLAADASNGATTTLVATPPPTNAYVN
jgi:hypothetical protein